MPGAATTPRSIAGAALAGRRLVRRRGAATRVARRPTGRRPRRDRRSRASRSRRPERVGASSSGCSRKPIAAAQHPLAALNTAFAPTRRCGSESRAGAVRRRADPSRLHRLAARGLAAQPRIVHRSWAAARGRRSCSISSTADPPLAGWINSVTQIEQAAGSRLTFYRAAAARRGAAHTSLLVGRARDQRGAHGRLLRPRRRASSATTSTSSSRGAGARTELFGLLLAGARPARRRPHADSTTRAGATRSNEDFRGIIGQRGRGVFNGKVVVEPGCQRIDARQSNDNLLLGDHAEIDTKPELEIYAERREVQPRLDRRRARCRAVVLLRARGARRSGRARRLLTTAFATTVVEQIRRPAAARADVSRTSRRGLRRLTEHMSVATAERSVAPLEDGISPRCARTSPRCSSSCTASRSRISTTRRRASRRRPCIEAMAPQQRLNHSNVHRGVHQLSERSTAAYEGAREKVRRFINAAAERGDRLHARHDRVDQPGRRELRRNASKPGDEVLITWIEHHSNIVPWQLLCERTGARLVVAPIRDDGSLDVAAFEQLAQPRARRSSRWRTSRTRSAP